MHTVPVWAHADGTYTSDIDRVQFESEGSFVSQDTANTEMDRWYVMIRNNAGAGTDFQYLGGDITDGFRTSGGDIAWIGADWLAGTTIDGDDTYAGIALPACRSGLIIEDVDGVFFRQFHASGTTGNWLDAVANGGQPAGTHWWPIAGLNDGGTNKIFCWHVNATIPPPYGTLLDVHLVSLSIFGTYASHVDTNLGTVTDNFWVDGVFRDTSFTYIYGEQFVPDYDADTAGAGLVPNYGQGSNLLSHYTLKCVARVANGSLGTVASWTFWDGSSWVSGATNAAPMVDDHGNQIRGDAGVKKIADGHYILASHQLIDTHLSVYRSANPQGPWTMISRVPAATQGQAFNGGVQIGQLVKVISVPPNAPAGHSMAIISRNLLRPTEPMAQHNIRRYAPQFVVIPNT